MISFCSTIKVGRVFSYFQISTKRRKMSVFVQKLNVLTGTNEWHVEDEQYDFHQEIARSAFADMLHDSDRNKKYYDALRIAIKEKHAKGERAHVLDIGTGTGLLSMMAVTCKADSVVACECFPPIANVARKVIEENGYKNQIKVVSKRSTELVVGKDMKRRANILVTEVFDTELIGEGAIETFNHAKKHLLEPDAVVIPSRGLMYAAVIESQLLLDHARLFPTKSVGKCKSIKIPDEVENCRGTPALHDLQVSQLPQSSFRLLTKPIQVFSFNFSKGDIKRKDSSFVLAQVVATGRADCVVVWWELEMLPKGGPVISCAPSWLPGVEVAPWRDHWMQAIYHLEGAPLTLEEASKVSLRSYHDQFSLWFRLERSLEEEEDTIPMVAPVCSCGLHITSSRSRMAMLNDESLWNKYYSVLSDSITPSSVVVYLGDTSFLPLLAAQLGAQKVYCVEENKMAFKVMKSLIAHNNLRKKVFLLSEYRSVQQEVDLVFSEPYFRAALLPWDQLRCWYLHRKLFPNARFLPERASICAVAVEFEHLDKIRAPLGVVEGFDMSAFDQLIKNSSDISDPNVEPHPLWEYPCTALSNPEEVMTFDLNNYIPEKCMSKDGQMNILSKGTCNGVALWMDWNFGSTMVSSGPVEPIIPGKKISWSILNKQGVFFVPEPQQFVIPDKSHINYNVTFKPSDGLCTFRFLKYSFIPLSPKS